MANNRVEDTLRDFSDSGPALDRVALLVVYRTGIQVVPLLAGGEVTIGRSEPADVRVPSKRLSRVHARFTYADGAVRVEDLNSSNGTLVNGARVRVADFGPDDEAMLGSVLVTLHQIGRSTDAVQGVLRHERFVEAVAAELERARAFGRGMAVLAVRALSARAMLARWVARIAALARPVDRVGLAGPDLVEILLVETTPEAAERFAQQILDERHESEPPLVVGIVVPAPGRQWDAKVLVSAARHAVSGASLGVPIVVHRFDPTTLGDDDPEGPVVRNAAMVEIFRTLDRVADSALTVLIRGETGVGKEIAARRIHTGSGRAGPLRFVNCGAIPGSLLESALFGHERGAFTGADRRHIGAFEEAAGGTVVLDEVGELSLAAQVALLRVLESRRLVRVGGTEEVAIDVRLVAATHRDLDAMCNEGAFRWDLYYRLSGFVVEIPPLRDRRDEVAPLVRRFVALANEVHRRDVRGLTDEAMAAVEAWDWPGNIRELRNAIERAVVLAAGDRVTLADLPALKGRSQISLSPQAPLQPQQRGLREEVAELERAVILGTLSATQGNQTRAAELLRMSRRTLVHKLPALGGADAWQGVEPARPRFDATGRRLGLADRIEALERARIAEALAQHDDNRSAAARALGIDVRTLDARLSGERDTDE